MCTDSQSVPGGLMNLLENAAVHGGSTHIRLSVECLSDAARFTAGDDGAGIAPELLPDIFSPSLASKIYGFDDRRNMGIGLSVCSSILRSHGGSMSAENAREGGTVFRFTLPIDRSIREELSYEDSGQGPDYRGRVQPQYIFTEIGVGYRMPDPA